MCWLVVGKSSLVWWATLVIMMSLIFQLKFSFTKFNQKVTTQHMKLLKEFNHSQK